jgi:hypothetical protein
LLTPSAIAYYAGGGQEKWALWQFCPTTEESLKNALEISGQYFIELKQLVLHYQQSLDLYKTDTCCRSLPLSIRQRVG